MLKYLVLNADDYGITKGVSEGIIEASDYGIVRSTTMFANSEHFDYAVSLLKGHDKLGVGAHLTLTYGMPVSRDVPSLVNKGGGFYKEAEFASVVDSMDDEEISREFAAQIEKLIGAGIKVTHLDTHHHIHKRPKIHNIVMELARKYDIGMRRTSLPCHGVKTTEEFTEKFHRSEASELNLKMLVKKFERAESLEIMCHPGKFDTELLSKSGYAKKREVELSVLTLYSLQLYLESMGVELVNFGQL